VPDEFSGLGTPSCACAGEGKPIAQAIAHATHIPATVRYPGFSRMFDFAFEERFPVLSERDYLVE
jgi:hypothetical protein